MAAIDDISLRAAEQMTVQDDIKRVVAEMFWVWFHLNYNKRILRIKKFGFLSLSVHVRDLESVFELLFGPKP